MPRFLHTADWQIGRQYTRLAPEHAVPLAEARFEAVQRIARLARDEQVDAVLVAGDIFDAQNVRDVTVRKLFNALQDYPGPWLMIPGNHDAALAESVWTTARRIGAIPDNVHLLLTPEVTEFEHLGFAVLPAPLTQRHTASDLTAWFDLADTSPGLVRVGIAHGSVQGILAEDIDSPNPIAADRAALARLDYLALGDWHGTRQIDPRTWYSGTPEQERFRDNNPGNVLLVDIPAPRELPQVEARAIGRHRWIQLNKRLAVASDLDQLIDELNDLPESAVVDLRLAGEVHLLGQQTLEQALSVAEARFRSLQADLSALRLQPTEEDINALQADGYVGDVLAELRQQQGEEENGLAREAMSILATLLLEAQAQRGEV